MTLRRRVCRVARGGGGNDDNDDDDDNGLGQRAKQRERFARAVQIRTLAGPPRVLTPAQAAGGSALEQCCTFATAFSGTAAARRSACRCTHCAPARGAQPRRIATDTHTHTHTHAADSDGADARATCWHAPLYDCGRARAGRFGRRRTARGTHVVEFAGKRVAQRRQPERRVAVAPAAKPARRAPLARAVPVGVEANGGVGRVGADGVIDLRRPTRRASRHATARRTRRGAPDHVTKVCAPPPPPPPPPRSNLRLLSTGRHTKQGQSRRRTARVRRRCAGARHVAGGAMHARTSIP